MTRRTFTVIDIVEILIHWSAGRKKAEVARSLGVDRGTVAKYTAKALAEGYGPGGESLSPERWGELVHGWFPELVDPRQRSLTHEAIEVHRADIEAMLKTNTATTVHQRLRDEHGLAVGLTSFRRYVWREFPEENLRNIATPPRLDDAGGNHPGQDAHDGLLGLFGQRPPSLGRSQGEFGYAQAQLGRRGYSEPSQRGSPPLFVGACRVG
jgi:hypothetical protein